MSDGRFRLIEILGRGGFATVWKAYDRREHQAVAVKVLHGQYAKDRTARERFFRGARKMAEVRHRGIVKVIERVLEDGEWHFFVMEYVDGGHLLQAVRTGKLTLRRRIEILCEVGEALHEAHRLGMVHRDIKPQNIVLSRQGQPKLTDFDLVRALDTTGGTRTSALGTFLYAAPEVLSRPARAEVTADVYGLGATAIVVLHGKEPPPITILRGAEPFIRQLPCSEAVQRALLRAVDPDPDKRFATVDELCRRLQAGLDRA